MDSPSESVQPLPPDAGRALANARNPTDLLFQFDEGSRVLVTIEGTDAAAERLAKRLYGILTARYCCEL